MDSQPTLPLSVGRLIKRLFSFALLIQVIAFGTLAIGEWTGRRRLWGLTAMFDLDREQAIPTWFNSMLLMAVAITALILYRIRQDKGPGRSRVFWSGFSLFFLLISVDEITGLHEIWGNMLADWFQMGGFLIFGFVTIGAAVAVLFFAVCIPFLRMFPRRLASGILLSCAVYFGGAVFVESLSANRLFLIRDRADVVYICLSNIEEFCEMTGCILLLHFLLEHLRGLMPGKDGWRVRLEP